MTKRAWKFPVYFEPFTCRLHNTCNQHLDHWKDTVFTRCIYCPLLCYLSFLFTSSSGVIALDGGYHFVYNPGIAETLDMICAVRVKCLSSSRSTTTRVSPWLRMFGENSGQHISIVGATTKEPPDEPQPNARIEDGGANSNQQSMAYIILP